MRLKYMFAILILSTSTNLNCSTEPNDELSANREKWESLDIWDYSFQIVNTGFLPRYRRNIFVIGNTVDSVYIVDDSLAVPDSTLSKHPTINDLFDEVERNLNSEAKTTVSYNSEYGFPEDVYRDYGEEGGGFRISQFQITGND